MQVRVGRTAGGGGCLQGPLLALRLGLETCVSRARRCFWLVVRRLASHVHGPKRYFQVFTESDCHCLIDVPGDEFYVKHALSACEIKTHPPLWGRSVSSLGSYVFLTRRFLALPPPAWVWAGALLNAGTTMSCFARPPARGAHTRGHRVPPPPADRAEVRPPPWATSPPRHAVLPAYRRPERGALPLHKCGPCMRLTCCLLLLPEPSPLTGSQPGPGPSCAPGYAPPPLSPPFGPL